MLFPKNFILASHVHLLLSSQTSNGAFGLKKDKKLGHNSFKKKKKVLLSVIETVLKPERVR